MTDVPAAMAFYEGAFGWRATYQDSSYAVLGAGAASVAVRSGIEKSWRGRSFRFADSVGNEVVVWSDREE